MSEPAAPGDDKFPARHWAIHTLLLFTAMAAPYFLIDIGTASMAAAGIGFVYVIWLLVALYLRDKGRPKRPLKIRLLFNFYSSSLPMAVGGLLLLLWVEWAMWAYRPITSAEKIGGVGMALLIFIAALLIFPHLLFLLLAPRLARKEGGDASRFLEGVRARGFGRFRRIWLSGTVTTAGTLGLMGVLFMSESFHRVERWRDGDGMATVWELVTAYPFLPFALLAVAAMQPLAWMLAPDWGANDGDIQAYIDGTGEGAAPTPGSPIALRGLVVGACIASLLVLIYPLHLSIAARGVKDGRRAIDAMSEAVVILMNSHEDDDRTMPEIADTLNRVGYWTPEAPEAGLGSLVANASEMFPDNCTVRITAGTLAPSVQESRSILDAEAGEPELKFCVVAACAPPFTWSATPALLLITSHPSEAEGWQGYGYADVFANGVAPAPGGYCMADGSLADSYQG